MRKPAPAVIEKNGQRFFPPGGLDDQVRKAVAIDIAGNQMQTAWRTDKTNRSASRSREMKLNGVIREGGARGLWLDDHQIREVVPIKVRDSKRQPMAERSGVSLRGLRRSNRKKKRKQDAEKQANGQRDTKA